MKEDRAYVARIRRFSQKLLVAREEERKHIASVLHHALGSLAVGVAAQHDALEDALASKKPIVTPTEIRLSQKLIAESFASLRKLSVRLRPPEFDALGVHASLRHHFAQFRLQTGVGVVFKETLRGRPLPSEVAMIVFRVAQEALTNAVSHGRAAQVDVLLKVSNTRVTLTVQDNGTGFDPSEHDGKEEVRMGIHMMREMAAGAGGTLDIDSARMNGTMVRLKLPLKTAPRTPTKRSGA